MSREQGDTKIDLGSTKNNLGEHHENNSGSREKKVKFQREPGAGDPPLRGLRYGLLKLVTHRGLPTGSPFLKTVNPGARGGGVL